VSLLRSNVGEILDAYLKLRRRDLDDLATEPVFEA